MALLFNSNPLKDTKYLRILLVLFLPFEANILLSWDESPFGYSIQQEITIFNSILIAMMSYKLIDNPDAKRYEFEMEGKRPIIEYIKAKNKIYLTHTEVPESMAGKGVGKALVGQVLEDIKEKGLTLIPLCPFVALYIKRNPEWKELVLKGINIG